MGTPGRIDPILALLDYLHDYRRSWRCWLIGGPAAVDDLNVGSSAQTAGARLSVKHVYVPLLDPAAGRFRPQRDGTPDPDACRAGRLFADALDTEGRYILFQANTSRQLADQLAAIPELQSPPPGPMDRALAKWSSTDPTPSLRLPSVGLSARVCWAGIVALRLGWVRGRFWAVGVTGRSRGVLKGLLPSFTLTEGRAGVLAAHTMGAVNLALVFYRTEGPLWVPGLLITLLWLGLSAVTLADGIRRPFPGWRYLRRCLHATPPPLTAVIGPDPGAAALLYALFAHLASHAQFADPMQGGTVLDDAYVDLPAMLVPEAPAPAWSATYRVHFGAGVPGPARARFVHVVCPEGGARDALGQRLLGRAARVWVVLPREMAQAEAAGYVERIRAQAPGAGITLVRDLPEVDARVPAEVVLGAGAPGDMWAVDLHRLRDRYLAGDVPPEEAAALVQWLVAGAEAKQPAGAGIAPPDAATTPAARRPREAMGGPGSA